MKIFFKFSSKPLSLATFTNETNCSFLKHFLTAKFLQKFEIVLLVKAKFLNPELVEEEQIFSAICLKPSSLKMISIFLDVKSSILKHPNTLKNVNTLIYNCKRLSDTKKYRCPLKKPFKSHNFELNLLLDYYPMICLCVENLAAIFEMGIFAEDYFLKSLIIQLPFVTNQWQYMYFYKMKLIKKKAKFSMHLFQNDQSSI